MVRSDGRATDLSSRAPSKTVTSTPSSPFNARKSEAPAIPPPTIAIRRTIELPWSLGSALEGLRPADCASRPSSLSSDGARHHAPGGSVQQSSTLGEDGCTSGCT